ncbi:MAG TPA: hypothetical protein VLK84_30780 [Longimicrobium sp.]|nr:hypothetical protein [Longimicrobium sp.]
MRLSRIVPLVFPALLLAMLAPAAMDAQQQVGNFLVERKTDLITDEDRSVAAVMAQERGQTLMLVWGCFGELAGAGFTIPNASSYDYAREMRMVWRFDRAEPEAVTLARATGAGLAYLLPEEYLHAFSARIRASSRLVVRVLNFSTTPTDYVFDLTGSERALGTLACMRNLRPDGSPAGVLGSAAEMMATPAPPLLTRADTVALIARFTPAEGREQRGEVAVQMRVTADGRVTWDGLQVTRTFDADFNQPASFIGSSLLFAPGRARRVTVFVYFSPAGGHIQVEDPG